jgi:hypothetical protein
MKKVTFVILLSSCFINACSSAPQRYLVKFVNYDGTFLYETYVNEGQDVEYIGEAPSKANSEDDLHFYTWNGWDTSLEGVNQDLIITATFEEGDRFLATFKNEDVVLQSSRFNENTVPVYEGKQPTKQHENEMLVYVFDGWDKKLSPITEDTVYNATFKETVSDKVIEILNDKDETIHTMADDPRAYVETVDDPNTVNSETAEVLYETGINNTSNGTNGIEIQWVKKSAHSKPYNVVIATDESLTDVVYTKQTSGNFVSLYNLLPGKYYYRIFDAFDNCYSELYSFNFVDRIRTIFNYDSVANMRDLGGLVTNDGKRIKYGNFFRSAELVNIVSKTESIFTETLGIKTELDVRFSSGDKDYSSSARPMSGVNYVNLGLTDAYPYMANQSATIKNIKTIFELIADKTNLPLIFHCTNGADRTGYLALLIEGALGVKDEDIYRDYELTSYYRYYQPRCDILYDPTTDTYSYDPTGYRTSTWNNGSFTRVINEIIEGYGSESNSISKNVCNFLINKCKVSQDIIDTMRANYLETF